ncbi:two component transcriptional regulator, LuxR family [Micromonospora eburnea]|uniref:Two component transcriptional regulator, LuxR family n=1 Tax=Micromonospora eburnea TaxID=227316 RepID=A0A1C6UWL1_9ACTN|nr:two component transcriptional regulator, LuxR family [Micromonospora eburnea]
MLVIDDHPVVCRGMTSLLQGEDWVGQVWEAGTVADARRIATLEGPHVAIVDLGLPDGDGIELTAQLTAAVPGCATIVMTMTNDPDTIQAALAAGAKGYLLKDASPELLVAAVRTVASGGRALGPGVDPESRGGRPTSRGRPVDLLTERERHLLGLLARGHTNRDIAAQLSLSEKTVRNQVSIIIGKLGVTGRVQAALLARQSGLA